MYKLPIGELGSRRRCKVGQDPLGDRSEFLPARREGDAVGAAVIGVGLSGNEAGLLDGAHERGHRLFRQPRPTRELPHPQAVLLEERDEHGPVRGSYLRETCASEPAFQALVPALESLREEPAQVVTSKLTHEIVPYQTILVKSGTTRGTARPRGARPSCTA